MIKLDPHEVCPFGSFCGYSIEFIGDTLSKCYGLDPDRETIFICELWAENYEKKRLTIKIINLIKLIGFIVKETFLYPLFYTIYTINDQYNILKVKRIKWKKE